MTLTKSKFAASPNTKVSGLYNRIRKKKVETHKYHEIAQTEKLWTEIETLQWVLSESRSIKRQLGHE